MGEEDPESQEQILSRPVTNAVISLDPDVQASIADLSSAVSRAYAHREAHTHARPITQSPSPEQNHTVDHAIHVILTFTLALETY